MVTWLVLIRKVVVMVFASFVGLTRHGSMAVFKKCNMLTNLKVVRRVGGGGSPHQRRQDGGSPYLRASGTKMAFSSFCGAHLHNSP